MNSECERLSPGLLYLEQLCRMLEEISSLQRQNQNLQLQIENIQEQREETQADRTEGVPGGCTAPEGVARLPEDFRSRSVSDTWTLVRKSSKLKTPRAEPFTSTDVLLEHPDDPPPMAKAEPKRAGSGLRLRMISLGKSGKSRSLKSSSSGVEKKMSFRQLFSGSRRRAAQLELEAPGQSHVQ